MTSHTEGGAVLAHVREVTRSAHAALEGALGLLDADLDAARYRKILERFYGFWIVWQPQVAVLLADESFLAPRRRLELLRADLVALGMTAATLSVLPRCPPVLLSNAQEALGSLYVMEGASLGGLVIKRNIETRLGEIGKAGCAYFSGYGPRTAAMWRDVLARLESEPVENKEDVGHGAVATFELLSRWLTRGQ